MPGILRDLLQRADLIERVLAGLRHLTGYGQRPGVQINPGIVIVVSVVREPLERRQFRIRKRRGRMRAPEQAGGGPVAQSDPTPEQPLAKWRNRERPGQQHRTQLEQLATTEALPFAWFDPGLHHRITAGPNEGCRMESISRVHVGT